MPLNVNHWQTRLMISKTSLTRVQITHTITRVGECNYEAKPFIEMLGIYTRHGGEARYFLRINDRVRSFRAMEMHGIAFLLSVYPSAEYWSATFPRPGRCQIDTKAAWAWIIGDCLKAGEFDPPPDMIPRSSGRPRKGSKVG